MEYVIFINQRETARLQSHCASADAVMLYLVYHIEAAWSRDSEYSCHQSAVDGNPLVGSTYVRVPTTVDSFNLLSNVF